MRLKKAKKISGKMVVLMLLLLPVLYIAAQFFLVLRTPYTTQTAIPASFSEKIACDGALAMSEAEVLYEGSGILNYQVGNGERVSAGNTVATLFATSADVQNYRYALKLGTQIDVLEKSQANATGADVEVLFREIKSNLYDMLDLLDGSQFAELNTKKNTALLAQNRLQLATGTAGGFSARSEQLIALRDSVLAAIGASTPITAPAAGYFVSGAASTKQLFSPDELRAMSPLDLQNALAQTPPPNAANVAGKIVQDYRWTYIALITQRQAAKLVQGNAVELTFDDFPEIVVPAKVVSIVEDEENNLAKVEFSCDYVNSSVITLEHASASIKLGTYAGATGLRIDSSARRIVDGVVGVYVLSASTTYFRPIEILYEDGNYLYVSSTWQDGVNEIKQYDEVVIKGRNLTDGKTI